jgi:hypothetical protein
MIGHIALVGHTELFLFFFLDFYLNTMSNSSYTLLKNSTDKLDVGIPIKEPVTSTMSNSNDALKKRYIQIAFAVTLYWYKIV